MNLMLVDDSIQTVKAIRCSIDWKRIGIDEVFTANNISEAKELFHGHEINIIISDIEMPQGSGIDLIKWVRNNSPNTESILLTCHAEFGYAKMAIELGSFDYLLKPIPFDELERIIVKLINKVETGRKVKKNSEYWVENQSAMEEKFWCDLMMKKIPDDPSVIETFARKRNANYSKDSEYLMILFTKKRLITRLDELDHDALMPQMKDLADKRVLNGQRSHVIVGLDEQIIVVLNSTYMSDRSVEMVKSDCVEYILECNKQLGCVLSCYIGSYCSGELLSKMYEKLQQMDADNVLSASKVFDLNNNQVGSKEVEVVVPNLNEWSLLLYHGENLQAVQEVVHYVNELVNSGKMNAKILNLLRQDILQMIYSFLEEKGVQAHMLFNDEHSEALYSKAKKSTDDLIVWVTYAFNKSMDFMNEIAKSNSIVNKAKEYIKNNYHKDITREDIAGDVYLNPDYLTRIFKKVTGVYLSDYLTEQRIKKSMKLLVGTNDRISDIATEVGYNNINYFSKMFKKVTGSTPLEYRKKHSKSA